MLFLKVARVPFWNRTSYCCGFDDDSHSQWTIDFGIPLFVALHLRLVFNYTVYSILWWKQEPSFFKIKLCPREDNLTICFSIHRLINAKLEFHWRPFYVNYYRFGKTFLSGRRIKLKYNKGCLRKGTSSYRKIHVKTRNKKNARK